MNWMDYFSMFDISVCVHGSYAHGKNEKYTALRI